VDRKMSEEEAKVEGVEEEKGEEGKVEEEREVPLVEEEEKESRIYTVPLKKAYYVPRYKRAKKAVKILREFIRRHMKAERVIISQRLNEKIWSRGIEKPPRRVKVKAVKSEEGVVEVDLASE